MFDVGILGGMGPRCSALFLANIHRLYAPREGQGALRCLLWSDPTLPDRTRCILAGEEDRFYEPFEAALDRIDSQTVRMIIVCCFTAHHFVDRLPQRLRGKILSLTATALRLVQERPARYLLVTTTGTRKVQLFERHELWPQVSEHIVLPEPGDQENLHAMLYGVKQRDACWEDVSYLKELLERYGCTACIGACTEMHLVTSLLGVRESGYLPVLDPLAEIARRLPEYL